MGSRVQYGSTLAAFGGTADRYVLGGYKPSPTVPEMMQLAASVPGLEGIELVGNWHLRDDNVPEIREALAKLSIDVACVTPDIWTQAKWAQGSLASRDARTRRAAVAEIQKCMDLASAMRCPYVDVWLGQDGYDYPFQGDFVRAWDWIIDGLRECAEHQPEVVVLVEYKAKEPRTHCYIANAAKSLLLIEKVDRPNLGVMLDVGHAWSAAENIAESVGMLKRFGDRLRYVHFNDNYRAWDDDMIAASVHTIEYLEFLYWLRATDFAGWYVLDIFPYREDSRGAVEESFAWIRALDRCIDVYGTDRIARVIDEGNAVAATRMAREMLLGR